MCSRHQNLATGSSSDRPDGSSPAGSAGSAASAGSSGSGSPAGSHGSATSSEENFAESLSSTIPGLDKPNKVSRPMPIPGTTGESASSRPAPGFQSCGEELPGCGTWVLGESGGTNAAPSLGGHSPR